MLLHLVCVCLFAGFVQSKAEQLQCAHLPMPDMLLDGEKAVFNPAAVYHSKLGWIAISRRVNFLVMSQLLI